MAQLMKVALLSLTNLSGTLDGEKILLKTTKRLGSRIKRVAPRSLTNLIKPLVLQDRIGKG
jgi:hypothetical protein